MNENKQQFNKLRPVSFEQVEILDNFWSNRQKINRDVSIHLQHEKLEINHHVDNFRVAAGVKKGIQRGEFYFDSDLYKWLEGACYMLHLHDDPELEKKVNEITDLIIKAQTRDGYLNTYFSTKFIRKRLTNLLVFHELYCAGHLIQAAIAHYNATGKETLLNVAKKFADYLVKAFLGGKIKGAPGHEEIEMALIELYRITNNDKYLELAQDFIYRRGRIKNYKTYAINQNLGWVFVSQSAIKIKKEFEKKKVYSEKLVKPKDEPVEFLGRLKLADWIKFVQEIINGKLYQLNVPVREAFEPVGHAVRAMYLYCGMADLYSERGDKSLLQALERIWLKMTKAKMYITGGIGSVRGTEGFGKDFALKNERSYSETCAAIGNIMWNWRMLQITGKCKHADLIERLIYNAMLVGQSIDGKRYTYDNPLVSLGKEERQEWFACACCPSNVARIIASLGGYIYSTSSKGIWIHQYIGSKVKINSSEKNELMLTQESKFPWKGNVRIKIELKNNQNFSIYLRIPNWCDETTLKINNLSYQDGLTPGKYIEIIRNWADGDIIDIEFKTIPKLETSDPRIKANRGRVVISNGPIIYCLEQRDNAHFNLFKMEISNNPELKIIYKSDFLNGMNIIQGKLSSNETFTAIPYHAWCNRGPNKMQIWNKIEK
ncbi:MAG: glycoside hydrolase family 127 protein [Promethearchaeota archaeon]